MIAIPFSGSKRNYVKSVEKMIERSHYNTVYEPFGGSAVLSVNLFNDGLIDKAVINDFDRLFDIYPEYLDLKDEIITKCLEHGLKKSGKKLPVEHQKFVQSLIEPVDKKFWPLLANNFVFSARVTAGVVLKDFVYFMNELGTEKQRNYLKGVENLERVCLDYRKFYEKYNNAFDSNALIILDPPYLNSAQKQYSNEEFFGLAETIDLLKSTKAARSDFLFFNMVAKDTRALLEVMNFNIDKFIVKSVGLNKSAKREDVMALVRQTPPVESNFFFA